MWSIEPHNFPNRRKLLNYIIHKNHNIKTDIIINIHKGQTNRYRKQNFFILSRQKPNETPRQRSISLQLSSKIIIIIIIHRTNPDRYVSIASPRKETRDVSKTLLFTASPARISRTDNTSHGPRTIYASTVSKTGGCLINSTRLGASL